MREQGKMGQGNASLLLSGVLIYEEAICVNVESCKTITGVDFTLQFAVIYEANYFLARHYVFKRNRRFSEEVIEIGNIPVPTQYSNEKDNW